MYNLCYVGLKIDVCVHSDFDFEIIGILVNGLQLRSVYIWARIIYFDSTVIHQLYVLTLLGYAYQKLESVHQGTMRHTQSYPM